MNITHLRSVLPKALGVTGAGVGGAVLLGACATSGPSAPDDIASGLVNEYDRGKVGADQAKTGERSLSLDGEHRKIVPRKELVDQGYYTDGYRTYDEVSDISELLGEADGNRSGDATSSEIAKVIARFDEDGSGHLDEFERADYEIEYAAKVDEINVGSDRDLNENGWDGIGEGIDILLGE